MTDQTNPPRPTPGPTASGSPSVPLTVPGNPVQIAAAVEARRKQLAGQALEPVPPREVMIGGRRVTLPQAPPHWEQMQQTAQRFQEQNRHITNYEQLTPWEREVMGALPGVERNFVVQGLQKLNELPVIGGVLNFFMKAVQETQRWAGYMYQAKFDEDLRNPSTIAALIFRRNQDLMRDGTPVQRKAVAAWETANAFYSTTAPENFGPVGLLQEELFGNFLTRRGLSEGFRFGVTPERRQINHDAVLNWLNSVLPPETDIERSLGTRVTSGGDYGHGYFVEQQRKIEAWWNAFREGGPLDVGGLPELIRMRERVLAGEDIEHVKAEHMQGLGALAFRGQIWETAMFIILDPAQYILPAIGGVVEQAHAARQFYLFSRVAPEITEAATDVRKSAEAIRGLEDIQQFSTHADDLLAAAERMGVQEVIDAAKAVKAGEGDLAEVTKALAQLEEPLRRLDEMQPLGRWGRTIVRLTGGDPFQPISKTRAGRWVSRANPLALSAAARADEFVDTMYNSISLVLREAGADVGKMVEYVKRGAAGAFGGRFGHMFISPIGRHVQGILKMVSEHMDGLLQVWQETALRRQLAEDVGRLIGTDVVDVVTRAGKGTEESKAIFQQMTAALDNVPKDNPRLLTLADAVRDGDFTIESLVEIGQIFRSTPANIIPYTPELFRAAVIKNVAETSAELAKVNFGVQQAAFFERASQYMKAAESLVLLGANPLYPIRNFFNNEVTMISRGVWGLVLPRSLARHIPILKNYVTTVEDVMESFNINPARLHEGFGISGPDVIADIARSTETAEEAALVGAKQILRRSVWGTPSGVGGWFLQKVHEVKDLRRIAGVMERMASERATTTALLKVWPRIWPRFHAKLDDFSPGLSDILGEEMAGLVADTVRGARRGEDLEAILTNPNLRLNIDTVMQRVARAMGVSEERLALVTDESVTESVRNVLRNLGPRPAPQAIQDAFDGIRDTVQSHLDEMFTSHIPDMVEEFAAKAEAEGNQAVVGLFGEFTDHLSVRHMDHMNRLDDAWARIARIEDPVLRSRAVRAILEDADLAWRRSWKYEGAVRQGIADGFRRRGVTVPDEFISSFTRMRDESQSFIQLRNKLWSEFWEGLPAGTDELAVRLRASEIHAELDKAYTHLIDTTDVSRAESDRAFLSSFPMADTQTQTAAGEWRAMIRRMGRTYMEAVLEHRQSIRGLPPEMQSAAWQEFHQTARQLWTDVGRMEEYGRRMLSGDPEALAFFSEQALRRGVNVDAVRTAQARWIRGLESDIDNLTPEEKLAFDAYMEQLPMSPGRRAIQDALGRYDQQGMSQFYEQARVRMQRELSVFSNEAPPENIHQALQAWTEQDSGWKDVLADFAKNNPAEAEAIQQRAQWWLYEHGFDNVPLFSGKLRIFRGPRHTLDLADLELRPWDSMTSRRSFAEGIAQGHGMPHLEFEVPVENVFSHFRAHPGFGQFVNEAEFVLNEKGYEGARLVSIGGHPPTPEEIAALQAKNPWLKVAMQEGNWRATLPDFDGTVGRQMYQGLPADELWFQNSGGILDEMERQALRLRDEPAAAISSLPVDVQDKLRNYVEHIRGQLNDAKLAAVRMSEGMRDAALLNYNRRYNFDNWLGVVAPYGFWWTHSMVRWAIHSIDRPFMLASYAKIRELLMNVQGEHRGFPTRLQNRIRIPLPFAPKEFGEAWIDPFSVVGLPFEQFVQPWQRWQQSITNIETRTERKLDELQRSGDLTPQDVAHAKSSRSGPAWDRARALVLERDQSLEFDVLDFMSMAASPHLPITALLNVARGHPEEIGVLPHTRTLRNVAALLGVDPGVYDNVWGNVRKALGLPAYDQWETYRIKRQLSNMIGENRVDPQEAMRQFTEQAGPLWDQARRESQRTEAGQWGYNLLGLPVNFYPQGEEHLRDITDLFFKAMNERDAGNPDALKKFFDRYPEYEARLALWRTPEEQMQQFLVDQVYNRYYSLPDFNRKEIRDQLGDTFTSTMLDPETRNANSISANVLGMWLRQMGGDAPGGFGGDALPIPLTRPDIAQRLQVFYDQRDMYYPNVFDIQTEYFKLAPAGRPAFRANNPVLELYWKERRDFMYRNPDLAPYMEEDPKKRPLYPSAQALESLQASQPNYTWEEWETAVSLPISRLVLDYFEGQDMPKVAQDRLEEVALQLGIEGGWRALADRMREVSPLTNP